MEFLKFNPLGQWSLHKAVNFTGTTKPDKAYQAYGGNAIQGALHEDRGQKGSLHNFGGGRRPKNAYNVRTAGKVKHPVHSVAAERNPGWGEEEVED